MKSVFLSLTIATLFLCSSPAFALNLGGGMANEAAGKAGYARNTTETTFAETLGVVVKGALSLVGVIFLVLMVYAGFLWMTAHGKEDQIEKAQEIIRSSIIGLIITVGAYSITAFVVPRIVGKATSGSSGVGTPAGVSCALPGGDNGTCYPVGNCPGSGVGVPSAACSAGQYCCR